MRKVLLALVATAFCGALAAQSSIGLSCRTVIHEPTAEDVGTYIQGLQIPNPDYDPNQPTGQPQFLPAYGNGKGISNELDSISREMYALGGTTTHDLIVLTNQSGANLLIDGQNNPPRITEIRPKKSPANAPEQVSPGHFSQIVIPYSNAVIDSPDGSNAQLCLVRTKWFAQLDTSPRDYIVTFEFDDISPGGVTLVLEVPLTVPEVRGGQGGACVASGGSTPGGVVLLGAGAVFAIANRRKLLRKA